MNEKLSAVQEIKKELLQTPEYDVALVLKESQTALNLLKDKIFAEEDQTKKLEYQKHIYDYVKNLSELSVVSDQEKQLLYTLQSKVDAKQIASLEEFQQILNLLQKIENKAEQLTALDKQKVRESQTVLKQQKLDLQSLQAAMPSLEEAQKKMIEQVKLHLDKHWWSKRLSGPIISYMEDKYIHKKPIGSFRKWIIGGVGMAIAGRFLPKGIKEIYEKIDTLSFDQLLKFLQGDKVESVKTQLQNLGSLAKEEYQALGNKMQEQMHHFFEKKFGRTFDKAKFAAVYQARQEEWKDAINLKGTVADAQNALHGKGEFDTLEAAFSMLMIPGKAGLDLLVRMEEAKLISWSELMIDGVILPSGKAMLNVGLASIGLFGNSLKMLFGQISADDLIDYLKQSNDRLNMDSKMAIWGVLYRRGGWFWKLAGNMGLATGEVISMICSGRTGGDVGKLSAYLQGGGMGKYQKELQVFKQLEESLTGTKMFNEIYSKNGSTLLEHMLQTNKKNLMLFDVMSNATSFAEIEKKLAQHGLDDVLVKLKDKPTWGSNLATIKKEAGNIISKNMDGLYQSAEDSLKTWSKWHKNLSLPWAKATYEVEFLNKMKDYTKLQGKLLQDTEMLHTTKNFFRKFTKGQQLASLVEYADQTKFYIKDVKTAKEFFDNVRTIGKHSPEILKTIFKGLPMIMIGKEVAEKLADPNTNDPRYATMLSGLMYMTPIVGPIKLIQEGLTIKDGQFSSLGSAGIGVGLVTLDGFFFAKNVLQAAKGAKMKAFSKFMFSPIVDSFEFVRSMFAGTFSAVKMVKNGVQVLKAGEYATFGAEALKFAKGTGVKIAGFAILAYLGYQGISSLLDTSSEEEKKLLAELEAMSPDALEEKIKSDRPKLSEEEKAQTIKLATAHRMGITNLDLLEVKKDRNEIEIKFKTLVNYSEMKMVQSDLQSALGALEATKDLKLDYKVDGGELKYQLLARKENFKNTEGKFDKSLLRTYLESMGYTGDNLEKLLTLV